MLGTWWFWAVAAAVLAVAEALAPGWVFLGFALGAAGMSLWLLAGGPFAMMVSGSASIQLLVFAVLSLAGWALLRRIFGARKGQVRIVRKDINDN
ncbi:hypothetical protein [Amaricoccus sp.]|uniref:NfeD family protein n=1 Tax=Amaricoccus sp. TaxID=1872485 RepID=UPI001B68AFD8|nr:hypothetical protein [Amaricoccus sp.]MBP7240671.1 hypothetical protein [Amaricoccus sp.]